MKRIESSSLGIRLGSTSARAAAGLEPSQVGPIQGDTRADNDRSPVHVGLAGDTLISYLHQNPELVDDLDDIVDECLDIYDADVVLSSTSCSINCKELGQMKFTFSRGFDKIFNESLLESVFLYKFFEKKLVLPRGLGKMPYVKYNPSKNQKRKS